MEPLLQRGDSLKPAERMQALALKARAPLLTRQPADGLHLAAVQAQLPAPNGAAQTLHEALSLLRTALGDKSLAEKEAIKLRG